VTALAGEILLKLKADIAGEAIFAGDYVTVREQDTAEPGQLVVAMVDGEARIRRYEADMVVVGLVVAVMRRVS
jgi:SOS-response transcriptional repressor LexA